MSRIAFRKVLISGHMNVLYVHCISGVLLISQTTEGALVASFILCKDRCLNGGHLFIYLKKITVLLRI